MSNVIALVKVLSKNMLSIFAKKDKKGASSTAGSKFGWLLFGGLMLLCFIPLAMSAYELSLGLGARGSNLVIQFLVLVVTLLSLFMGLLTNISILFLSKDNDQLLYLPFKPSEVFVARMIMSLFSTYFLIFLFFIPSAIGVGIAQSAGVMYYLSALLVTLLVPIVPVIISSTLLVIFVSIFKFLRNKNVVTYTILILSFVLGFGVSYMMESYMPEITSETDVFMLISRYEEAINSMCQYLMFALPLVKLVDIGVVWSMRLVWIVVYIGLVTIATVIAVMFSSKLYLKSLLNINGNNKKKKYSKVKADKELKQKRYVFMELMNNEKRSLFRNPMAFMNLLLPVAIPIIVVIYLLISISELDQISINSMIPYIEDYYTQIILIIAFAYSITSLYSSVSYSKEGNNNFTLNYLPVSFMKVFMSKVILGTILNVVPFIISIMAVLFIVDIEIVSLIYGIVCGILGIFTINLIGVFIDVNRPKVKWNSDVEAVKNNMNAFYYMIASLVFFAILILLSDFAGLIELLVIVMLFTIIKCNENKYRDNLC